MAPDVTSEQANPWLQTYLNDHLAGAAAGLTLLDDLLQATADPAAVETVALLRAEVDEDKRVLEALIESLGFRESRLRSTSAWLAEKAAWLKARVDGHANASFTLFELLEAMSLGVQGKRLLWLALASVAETSPALGGVDYSRLVDRAEDQRRRLETLRRVAALQAFAPAT